MIMSDREGMAQDRRFEASYMDWKRITYQPAIDHHLPIELVPALKDQAAVLDIGCHDGAVCLFLAREGFQVDGVDINADAVQRAVAATSAAGLAGRVSFTIADAVVEPLAPHDAVTLIRVLTCIPNEVDWHRLLRRAWSAVRPGGLLYVHDFLRVGDNPAYKDRYEEGQARGWRAGNFLVKDRSGEELFVAHHHDSDELAAIAEGGETLLLRDHPSVSMNGNACHMFVYIGRKALLPSRSTSA